MTDQKPPSTELCYPVLTPFKFEGVIVKPPAFIQLSEEEAAPYIADEVLGADSVELPDDASAVIAATSTNTTTTSEANPAGGAPPAGKAAARKAVVRKPAQRK